MPFHGYGVMVSKQNKSSRSFFTSHAEPQNKALHLSISEQKLQTPDYCVSVTISVDKVLHDLYWEPVKKGDEFGPYLRTSSSHDVFTNSVLRIYDFTYVISFVYFYTRRGLLVIEYHTLETNAIVATYLW